MRARRTVYIVIFVAASLIAAGAYYLAQPRVEIVRARQDISVLTPHQRRHGRARPGQPARCPVFLGSFARCGRRAVCGAADPRRPGRRYPRDRGDARIAGLRLRSTAGSRRGRVRAPRGTADQAVGGALSPGARVDVIAVPNELKTGLAAASRGPGAVTMGQGLTILALRTGDGHQLTDVQRADRRRSSRPSSDPWSSPFPQPASPTSRPQR